MSRSFMTVSGPGLSVDVPVRYETRMKVENATHRGWFCYDIVVSVVATIEGEDISTAEDRRYTDIEHGAYWWQRVWHWIAQPIRRWRGYGRMPVDLQHFEDLL